MPSFERKLDIEYSHQVERPHPDWVKPFDGGALRALMIPGIRTGREIVELCQRFDVDAQTVTIDREWDINRWGLGDFYNANRTAIWDFELVYKNLENALLSNEEFDVLVLPGLNGWGMFTESAQRAILERVERGAGLVIVRPMHGLGFKGEELFSEVLDVLSPLAPLFNEGYKSDRFAGDGFPDVRYDLMRRGAWVAGDHPVTRGIPFELFPGDHLAYYPYEARGEVILRSESGDPIAAVREYGRGRVVALGYYPRSILPQHADFTGRENFYESIIDNIAGAKRPTTYDFLEYAYGFVFRAMAWSCRRLDGGLSLCADETGVSVAGAQAGDELLVRVSDDWDGVVHEARVSVAPRIELPEKLARLGGDYRADVRIDRNGAIADFGCAQLKFPRAADIVSIALDRALYQKGDIAAIEVVTSGAAAHLSVTLVDDFGRVMARFEKDAQAGVHRFEHRIEDWKSLHIRAAAEVSIEGHRVRRAQTDTAIVAPGAYRFVRDYEVFMNSQNRGQGDMWELQRKLSLALGVTAAFPGSVKSLTETGAQGLGIYWYHRHPYVARKEKYVTTRDKKHLTRVPCLNDEAFWQKNEAAIEKTVGRNRKYMPVSYYANDEGSLTCYTDDLELCFCHNCMDHMQGWLQEKYGSLEALNDAWKTSFSNWADVQPDTFDEAYARNNYASWGDHRLFMEYTFANAYRRIAAGVKAQDPDGVIRMSGCQASTAYSGYDYYQLHRHIGYFEAYGGGNQMELHRSFKKPETLVGGWLGYGHKGRSIQHSIWSAILHGLTMTSVFCEFSMINPDFSYFRGALDMGETFREIRQNGIAKLLLYGAKRDSLGIAIHYSMPSIHASYPSGTHRGAFEKNRQGWVDVLEDLGYQYDFIATQQIEVGELSRYKVLILPLSKAMSAAEVEAIRAFARGGGLVLADCQCALMDSNCAQLDQGRLDDLMGIRRYSARMAPFYCNNGDVADESFPYFRVEAKEDQGLKLAEPDTRVSTGRAALVQDFSRLVPALVVNRFGDGFGVYLNSLLDEYPSQRNDPDSPAREFIGKVLGMAGIERFAELFDADGQPVLGGVESVFYTDGGAQYLALLRGFSRGGRVAYDGRTEADQQAGEALDQYVARFNGKKHLYDVRAGKYLGFSDEARISLRQGDAAVLAALPDLVRGVSIDAPESVNAGDWLDIGLRVDSDKEDGAYNSVLSLQVFDADGGHDPHDSQNLITQDLSAFKRFQVPYNAPRGQMTLRLRDAASGMTCQKRINVL